MTKVNERNEAVLNFEYYKTLAKATNPKDLNQAIVNIIKSMGFTDYSFTQLAKADIAQPELCTLPEELLHTYFDNALYVHDVALQKAVNPTEPFFHSTVHGYISKSPFSSQMTLCMESIYKLYKSYGYYDFFHAVNHSRTGSFMLSVTQRGPPPLSSKAI